MNKPERNLEKLRKIVVKKALEGEKIKKVAHDYMVSRKFVYKWLKRFRENPEGEWWKDRSFRHKTIHRKVNEELKERIRELRLKQGMNTVKIAYLLKREGKALSQTTVTKVIGELGLPLRSNRKKKNRTRYKSFERKKPNEL